MKTTKKCTLDCEFQHEGFCALREYLNSHNLDYAKIPKCTAKSNDDLVCSECGKKDCGCS